jgi:hypothetical protein
MLLGLSPLKICYIASYAPKNSIYSHTSSLARTAIDSFPALFNQRLLIGVLQERLKVESEGVGAIALGQWFQSRDRCESKVNCFPVRLEQ